MYFHLLFYRLLKMFRNKWIKWKKKTKFNLNSTLSKQHTQTYKCFVINYINSYGNKALHNNNDKALKIYHVLESCNFSWYSVNKIGIA